MPTIRYSVAKIALFFPCTNYHYSTLSPFTPYRYPEIGSRRVCTYIFSWFFTYILCVILIRRDKLMPVIPSYVVSFIVRSTS